MEKLKDKKNQDNFTVIHSNRSFDADISKQFMKKRKRKKEFDFEINANGEKIPVHKEVLTKRCCYFDTMFRHSFNETNSNSVSLSNEACSAMPEVVDYLYSGKIKINNQNVFDIFSTVRYLHLDTLETNCIDYIKKCVNHNTVANICDISQQNYMSDLVDYTLEFMEKHFEEFIKHKALKRWSFKLINDLLQSSRVQVNSETKVIQLITNWLSFDFASRKSHIGELLGHVRYSFLTPEKIASAVGDDACLKILHTCSNLFSKCMNTERLLQLRVSFPRLYNKGIYLFGKPKEGHPEVPFGRYWPSDNTFTKLKSPSDYRTSAAVGVLEDKVYLVGGRVKGVLVNTVEVYDPVTNTWSFTQPLNRARAHHCCCCFKGNLFVVGGKDGRGLAASSEIYFPKRGCWLVLKHVEKARYGAKAVVLGDSMFVVRGYEDERKQDSYLVSECQLDPCSKNELGTFNWSEHPRNIHMEKHMLEVLVVGFGTKLFIFRRRKQVVIYNTKSKTCTTGHLYNPANTIDVHNCRQVVAFHDKIFLSQNQTKVGRGKFNRRFAVFDPMLLEDMDKETLTHQRQQIRASYQCEKTVKLEMDSLEYCVSCN